MLYQWTTGPTELVSVEAEFFFFFPSKGLDVPDKHDCLEMKMNRR